MCLNAWNGREEFGTRDQRTSPVNLGREKWSKAQSLIQENYQNRKAKRISRGKEETRSALN